MSELDDLICPESKITPRISRDARLNMPITVVIIDEVQVFLENPTISRCGVTDGLPLAGHWGPDDLVRARQPR